MDLGYKYQANAPCAICQMRAPTTETSVKIDEKTTYTGTTRHVETTSITVPVCQECKKWHDDFTNPFLIGCLVIALSACIVGIFFRDLVGLGAFLVLLGFADLVPFVIRQSAREREAKEKVLNWLEKYRIRY